MKNSLYQKIRERFITITKANAGLFIREINLGQIYLEPSTRQFPERHFPPAPSLPRRRERPDTHLNYLRALPSSGVSGIEACKSALSYTSQRGSLRMKTSEINKRWQLGASVGTVPRRAVDGRESKRTLS